MARRRSRRVYILLPDEAEQRRRSFLVKGLAGALLLALGGGVWFARRRTYIAPEAIGPFVVFSPDEASVLLAIADRLIPERAEFPRPRALSLAQRMDAIAARADPATQPELRRLVRTFESALTGFLVDAQANPFTASSPAEQDRRLRAWAESRIAIRRTGFQALKRLVYAAYYGSPESWAAVGYPGPPSRAAAREAQARVASRPARRPSPPEPDVSDGHTTERLAEPDRRADAPAQPLDLDRRAAAPAKPPGSEHRAPLPPRRKRAFTPLKPFTEQPLEPAPTLMTPRGDDG